MTKMLWLFLIIISIVFAMGFYLCSDYFLNSLPLEEDFPSHESIRKINGNHSKSLEAKDWEDRQKVLPPPIQDREWKDYP
jgi:hypothetical protein